MKHRWPRSLHSQAEAVFHSIRSFRKSKVNTYLGIRSFGTAKVYRYEWHRFIKFMQQKGRTSILDVLSVQDDMTDYLEERLAHYVARKKSRQTMETILSAMGKMEYAINRYLEIHLPDHPRLDTEKLRLDYYARARKQLRKSSRDFSNRAYPDPVGLIEAIKDVVFQLQACLQYEGGLRAEGVGAPSNRTVRNPLTKNGLHGVGTDPVTGAAVGIVVTAEKGGKKTAHYVSVETYRKLEEYITQHGKLESDYLSYENAITQAAKATGQFVSGRGSHGLKHNFAQERYLQSVDHGLTHEMALQQTSLELSHFRLKETLTYTGG